MRFIPAVELMRTAEERRDAVQSWQRSDERFFASGACHILAFRFLERHPDSHCELTLVQPAGGFLGSHVYVAKQGWALDFNGWTPEHVFLSETKAASERLWPGWDYELITVTSEPLEDFCRSRGFRPPSDYAGDVLARADIYLAVLPAEPPT